MSEALAGVLTFILKVSLLMTLFVGIGAYWYVVGRIAWRKAVGERLARQTAARPFEPRPREPRD